MGVDVTCWHDWVCIIRKFAHFIARRHAHVFVYLLGYGDISNAVANDDYNGFWEECCWQVKMCKGVYGCTCAWHAIT